MTAIEGKMLTCDLCGETVFLKHVNDGIREHEDPPEGWGYWHVGNVINSTLCPSCNERMQEALLACIGKIKGDDQDD